MELRGWDFGGVAVRSGRAGVELEGTFAAAAAAAAVRSASLVSTHAHFSTCDDEHLEGGGKVLRTGVYVRFVHLFTSIAGVESSRVLLDPVAHGIGESQLLARVSPSWPSMISLRQDCRPVRECTSSAGDACDRQKWS